MQIRRRGSWRAMAAFAVVGIVYGAIVNPFDGAKPVTEGARDRCSADGDLLAVQLNGGVRDLPYTETSFEDGVSTVALLRSNERALSFVTARDQGVHDPALSPDGRQVAVTWDDGDHESSGPASESIWVVDTDDGDARLLTTGRFDEQPTWSPDGEWIAFARLHRDAEDDDHGQIGLVDAAGGDVRVLADLGEDRYVDGLAWLPGGERLIVWSQGDTRERTTDVVLVGVDGRMEQVATLDGAVIDGEVVPGGDEILLTVLEGEVGDASAVRRVLDLASGDLRKVGGALEDVRWTPDGRRLYLSDWSGYSVAPEDRSASPLRRGRFTGEEVEALVDDEGRPSGAVPFEADRLLEDLSVGPCGEVEPTGDRPDRPLLDTEWRLGPDRLVVSESEAVEGCEAPACVPIRIEASTERTPGTTCTVLTGLLRGDDLTETQVISEPEGEGNECWFGERWGEDPPRRLEVDGDVLHFVVGEHGYERRFGALDVAD